MLKTRQSSRFSCGSLTPKWITWRQPPAPVLLPKAMPRNCRPVTPNGWSRKQLYTYSHNEVKAARYLEDPKSFRPEELDENLSPLKKQKKTEDDVKKESVATVKEEVVEAEEAEAGEEDDAAAWLWFKEDDAAAEEEKPRKSYRKMMIANGRLKTKYANQSSMKKTKSGCKYKKMSDAAKQRPQAKAIAKFGKACKLALELGENREATFWKASREGDP